MPGEENTLVPIVVHIKPNPALDFTGRQLAHRDRIIRVLNERGYAAEPVQADHIWLTYSETLSVGWAPLPADDEDLYSLIAPHFSPAE